ncbi:MAG: cytochrome c oxidase subunit II [bacterium]
MKSKLYLIVFVLITLAVLILPYMLIKVPPVSTVNRYSDYWLPQANSTYAPKIDGMFNTILWITMIVFVLVELGFIYFIWKYSHKDGRKVKYTHGNNKLEIAWTIVPAVILVFLAIFSNSIWSEIRNPNTFPKGAASIQIKPRQFQWDIVYPGPDGKFDTPDDISTINQLYLAYNEPVQIKLKSQDVIHSFFVPEFRIKQDAVPGMPTAVWIVPTKMGDFNIACAELCGAQHYRMMGYVHVVSKDSLTNWQKSQAVPEAPAPVTPAPQDTTTKK